MKYFIVLPAFNEENALPFLLNSINKELKSICPITVIVNDGSTDNTRRTAEDYVSKMPLILINHEKNQGLGAALNTAFNYLSKTAHDDDIFITMDADDSHKPSFIYKMLPLFSKSDIVIASRFCAGGSQSGTSLLRYLLSKCLNLVLRQVFSIKGVNDFSSGYRAYKAKIIKEGIKKHTTKLIEHAGFSCMAEILIKLSAIGAEIDEVPLTLYYQDKKSKSKLKPFSILMGYTYILFSALKHRSKARNCIRKL